MSCRSVPHRDARRYPAGRSAQQQQRQSHAKPGAWPVRRRASRATGAATVAASRLLTASCTGRPCRAGIRRARRLSQQTPPAQWPLVHCTSNAACRARAPPPSPGPHTPSSPETLSSARQRSLAAQVRSQQMPSSQCPLAHSSRGCTSARLSARRIGPRRRCARSGQSASDWQGAQAGLRPLQAKGPHVGLPSKPAGKIVQVPSAAAPSAIEQAPQAPAQSMLQQRSSTQCPLAQSASVEQAPPLSIRARRRRRRREAGRRNWPRSGRGRRRARRTSRTGRRMSPSLATSLCSSVQGPAISREDVRRAATGRPQCTDRARSAASETAPPNRSPSAPSLATSFCSSVQGRRRGAAIRTKT